jgi:hypothetical protein
MTTNDFKITPANWDGPGGTSWIINESAQGKVSFARHRASQRIAQAPMPQPASQTVFVPQRTEPFVGSYVATLPPPGSRARAAVIGGIAGAILGKTVEDVIRRNRRR